MNPEWNITDRTHREIQQMAALGKFTAEEGDVVRPVEPNAVIVWKVPEGGSQVRNAGRIENIILPGILVSLVSATGTIGAGLNCADDVPVLMAVQIVDNVPHQVSGPLRTYTKWMNLIRSMLTRVPNVFLQDANPEDYDPFVVHVLKRTPAEAQSLIRHDQQVAVLSFQVMVRQHRG